MLGQLSISFCDICNEFGMVSVVDGKLMIQYCDCEVETVEGEQQWDTQQQLDLQIQT